MRVQIYFCNAAAEEKCNEIFKHATSTLEEKNGSKFIGEISLEDLQVLTGPDLMVRKLAKIPGKAELPFEIPHHPSHYELRIPYLPKHGEEQLEALGVKGLEIIGYKYLNGICTDKYLVYLTPDQVNSVYNLPFVHSLAPK